ncbi:MAG: type II toxin-antitoxin system RelE/ParE family toxin [Pseudomonadota bacterium]
MPKRLHTVIATRTFEISAKSAGIKDGEVDSLVTLLAANPLAGDLVPGTGGARKVRLAAKGRGKRGSYRTYHYFGGDDVPVFLLAAFAKNEKSDLSSSEKEALRSLLSHLASDYRENRRRTGR